jgi:hypothetical protein
MSHLGGRGGRSDDWSSLHLRARARASERLDGPLDPAEAAWLDDHLADCPDCAAAAADYAGQQLELRALRDRQPVPPRDLWARTAAAIEREARPSARGGRRSARSLLAPYALLAGALIVAIAVGTLSVSQLNGPGATASAAASIATALGLPSDAAATPIPVGPGSVAYVTSRDGLLQLNHLNFNHVCGPTTTCATSSPADTQSIGESGHGIRGGRRRPAARRLLEGKRVGWAGLRDRHSHPAAQSSAQPDAVGDDDGFSVRDSDHHRDCQRKREPGRLSNARVRLAARVAQ